VLGEADRYGGRVVSAEALATFADMSTEQFRPIFSDILTQWHRAGVRGAWLRVPSAAAGVIVGPALASGFDFHSACPGGVVLAGWLPGMTPPVTDEDTSPPPHRTSDSSRPSPLPLGPTHTVGVGAVCVSMDHGDEPRVLVVRERRGPLGGTGVPKMPTGLTEPGEDLLDAVVREVREETGIDAVPMGVLAVRQMHGGAYGQSDLFFVIGMRVRGRRGPTFVAGSRPSTRAPAGGLPPPHEGAESFVSAAKAARAGIPDLSEGPPASLNLVHQASEVDSAEWMPLSEYQARCGMVEGAETPAHLCAGDPGPSLCRSTPHHNPPIRRPQAVAHFRERPLYAHMIDRCCAWVRGEVAAIPAGVLDAGRGRGDQLMSVV